MLRTTGLITLLACLTLCPANTSASPVPEAKAGVGLTLDQLQFDGEVFHQVLEDGRRVVLTLDPALQRFADKLFKKYKVPAGAAVLLNSKTGRILALSQYRAKPELMDSRTLALDPSAPAASLFKVITAAALLEEGRASLKTQTCFHGGAGRLTGEHLTDSPKQDTACVSLATALGKSVNAVFAKLSDRNLKREELIAYADRFGFNRRLPFDVQLKTSTAEIPTDRLERARTAAGFWHSHISALHAAVIMQTLAQKGAMLRPYIVDHIEDGDGVHLFDTQPQFIGRPVSEATARALIDAMTVTVTRGTARGAFHDKRGIPYLMDIDVSGKTGTLMGRRPYRAYTWFAGLAPADKPELAVAVLVVNEPKWRIKASGIAMQLLREYFALKRNPRQR